MKRVLIIILFFISCNSSAQKGQRIAFVDMNYILENIPEYVEAQSRLDAKVKGWQLKLDVLTNEINTLKTDLSNEKPLLTSELIQEREEDILIKEKELKRLQAAFFGPTGDLFQMRRQLAKPIQDQVYNSIQTISANKRYDIVFDKSSDLIMLYTNKKFDISEVVLNTIVKNRKRKAVQDKRNAKMVTAGVVKSENTEPQKTDSVNTDDENVEIEEELISEQKTKEQQKIEDRLAKREALKAKIKAQQEARVRVRDSLRKVANEERTAKLKEIEDRKKAREEKIGNNN